MTNRGLTRTLLLLFLTLMVLSLVCISVVRAGEIAIYWGHNAHEGTLRSACAVGNYNIVIIAVLNVFGNDQNPELNLSGHCDLSSGECATSLSTDIIYCQNRKIKVMLSIGGRYGRYTLSSSTDAKNVADYLWNNFLGGTSTSRSELLGDAYLDGIDFDIQIGSTQYYDHLAKSLTGYNGQGTKRVYLTASPRCTYPDTHLNDAISTKVFDYVWVKFFNNPTSDYNCEYNSLTGNVNNLLTTWKKWITSEEVSESKIMLGLLASEEGGSGFIPANVLITQILTAVKSSSKYGGVMLWDVYYDYETGYSFSIRSSV